MPNLTDLETTYFVSGAGTPGNFTANTLVIPHIDGVTYFDAIYQAIMSTGANDQIYIVNWNIQLDWDITEKTPPYILGQLLVDKANLGVDVRIILNGTLYLRHVPKLAAWKSNLMACELLRSWKVSGTTTTPLNGRVLYDWSGDNLSGSHHQKAVFVKGGNILYGFVGGMDFEPLKRDAVPHNKKPWSDGTPWGWHDMGVELRGEAALGVWSNFQQRWEEARTLPPKTYWKRLTGDILPSSLELNPTPILPISTSPPVNAAPVSTHHSVRILRSRFPLKIPNRFLVGGVSWTTSPAGAIWEVRAVLRKAISAARKYIYIEDQFLEDQLSLGSIPPGFSLFPDISKAILANNGLKVIFVGSGLSDPDDLPFIRGRKNLKLTSGIQTHVLDPLPASLQTNVAVWRLENATVHSKFMMIDDEFAAVGSANFQSRSMYGVDSELHAAFVSDDDTIKNLRVALWGEHLRLGPPPAPPPPAISTALEDLEQSLGMWRSGWYAADPSLWWQSNHPVGHRGHGALGFVGPS